ncbi:hypothetical protein RFI_39839, partial [Reticulomyxa filosa]
MKKKNKNKKEDNKKKIKKIRKKIKKIKKKKEKNKGKKKNGIINERRLIAQTKLILEDLAVFSDSNLYSFVASSVAASFKTVWVQFKVEGDEKKSIEVGKKYS